MPEREQRDDQSNEQRDEQTLEQTLDTRGLICPIPVLKARKRMRQMRKGEVLIVQSDDPSSLQDFQHFCQTQGYSLLEQTRDAGTTPHTLTHRIRA